MSRTPEEVLATLREKSPDIAAAMDAKATVHIETLDRLFEHYVSMCMQSASILSVIAADEAKAPEEKEDARKSAVVAHALVGALHEMITKLPPSTRVAMIESFTTLIVQFMANNEAKLGDEIEKSRTTRHQMLERLAAARAAPVAGL